MDNSVYGKGLNQGIVMFGEWYRRECLSNDMGTVHLVRSNQTAKWLIVELPWYYHWKYRSGMYIYGTGQSDAKAVDCGEQTRMGRGALRYKIVCCRTKGLQLGLFSRRADLMVQN